MICTAQQMLLGRINGSGRGGLDVRWERREEGEGMRTAFQWINLKERGNLGNLGVSGNTVL